MDHPVDTATRAQFITGLRELADYLAAHPAIPVPVYGERIIVVMNSPGEGGTFQVRQAARLLGTCVSDETAHGGHYYTQKAFGPLVFCVVSIPDTCMARHVASSSYHGCVDPQ